MTTTTTTRPTLADLNVHAFDDTTTWPGYTQHASYAVGRGGRRNQGDKLHVLLVTTITAKTIPDKPLAYRVGDRCSVITSCNSNGAFTGSVADGYDTDKVTCRSCLRWLERAAQRQKEELDRIIAREMAQEAFPGVDAPAGYQPPHWTEYLPGAAEWTAGLDRDDGMIV